MPFAFITILLLTPTAAAGVTDHAWNLQAVRSLEAPANSNSRVLVAVLDSGVREDAAALSEAVIVEGWNFVDRNARTADDNGHGTHIASLVAGRAGGPPLCGECEILPVKVLDTRGLGDAGTLAAGIRYAVDRGAQVINMSMGFDPGYEPGPTLAEAVAYAHEHGVVMVASVGNEGRAGATYPASYRGVIAVAAVDYDRRRTSYSNVSPGVDVAAPGGDDQDRNGDGVPESILSDGLSKHSGGGTEPWLYSGTSQAAAHVSALAGRLIAHGVPAGKIEPLIMATAQDVEPAGIDVGTGAGLIDFAAALRWLESHSMEELPLGWEDRFHHELKEQLNHKVELSVRHADGRPAGGALVFGHWRGTRRVLVLEMDEWGQLEIAQEGIRGSDFVVDRILDGGPIHKPELFLRHRSRPYEGIVASPLSRYPR